MPKLIPLFIYVCFFSFEINAQVFTEYENNPVIDTLLTEDESEFWTRWKSDPYLIHWDSDSLRMYYGTNNYGEQTQIGTAVSANGNHWIENREGPVLASGVAGAWDETNVETPGVLFVPTNPDSMRYLMYYSGGTSAEEVLDIVLVDGPYPGDIFQLGLAYSEDGIHFTKYNNPDTDGDPLYVESDPVIRIPVVEGGLPTEVNEYFASAAEPSPYYDEDAGLFKMWFIGLGCDDPTCAGEDNYRYRVLYSESADGIHWGDASVCLDRGTEPDFDSGFIYAPHVVQYNAEYLMFYGGSTVTEIDGFSLFEQEIGLAISTDWVTFEKQPENPLIEDGDATTWNDYGSNYPAGIVYHDTLRVYYSGVEDDASGFLPMIGYSWLAPESMGLNTDDFQGNLALTCFPNPSSGQVTLGANGDRIERVQVMHINGEIVLDLDQIAQDDIVLNLPEIDNGCYIIRAFTESAGIQTTRLTLIR